MIMFLKRKVTLIGNIIATCILTIGSLFFTIALTGGGHGTYLPMKIVFPYSMIISNYADKINALAMILGVIQIPIYVAILGLKNKWKYLIFLVHIIAVIFVFSMTNSTFTP